MKHLASRFVLPVALFLCTFPSLAAQSLAQTAPEGRVRPYLAGSPLKVFEPVNRGLLGAAGLVWPAGWSAEIGYLWLIPQDNELVNVDNQRGGRMHLTARRYFVQRPETPLVPFVQLRGDLLRRTHRTVATFEEGETADRELILYQDSVGVDTRTRTLNLMVGLDWSMSRHFSVELSAGVGKRFRRVSYFDRIRPGDREFKNYRDLADLRNDVGEFNTFNLPVDLRLIYRW